MVAVSALRAMAPHVTPDPAVDLCRMKPEFVTEAVAVVAMIHGSLSVCARAPGGLATL